MASATFAFDAADDLASRIADTINRISGLAARVESDGDSRRMLVQTYPPFDAPRLDAAAHALTDFGIAAERTDH
jgi:hypothetical protein